MLHITDADYADHRLNRSLQLLTDTYCYHVLKQHTVNVVCVLDELGLVYTRTVRKFYFQLSDCLLHKMNSGHWSYCAS